MKHLQSGFLFFDFNRSLIYFSHCSPCFWQLKRTQTECIHSQVARRLDLADEAVFALQLYQLESRLGSSAAWQARQNLRACAVWDFLHPLVAAGGGRLIGCSPVRQSGARASRLNAKSPDGVVFCEAKHLQRLTRRLQCQVRAASRPEKPTVRIKSSAEPRDCTSSSALLGQQRSDECFPGVRPSYQTPVGNIFNQTTAASVGFALRPTSCFKRLHDVHLEEAYSAN